MPQANRETRAAMPNPVLFILVSRSAQQTNGGICITSPVSSAARRCSTHADATHYASYLGRGLAQLLLANVFTYVPMYLRMYVRVYISSAFL